MAMTLASIKKGKAEKPPLMILYGVAGVGKTSLAAEAPAPIFLRTKGEDYPTDVEPDEFGEAADFWDVKEAIEVLKANADLPFKTFIIDSADGLEQLVQAEACRVNEWKSIEDPGYGKGYVAAMVHWNELLDGLNDLRALGMNVILLAHNKINRFDSPTSDPYSRYKLNLQDRADDFIRGAADLVGFINYRVTLKQADAGFNKKVTHGEGGGNRVIYVEERPGYIAKNRFGMPPSIDYKKGEGWNSLAKYMPTAAV